MAYQNRQCIRSMETVKLRRTGVCNARPSIFITINPYGSVSVSGVDLIPEKPSPNGRRELEIRTWTHGTIKVMKDRDGYWYTPSYYYEVV